MAVKIRTPLCLREALLSIARRPVRSLLVLQAIVWGSAVAIFPQAIYEGSRKAASTRSGELAVDRVIVTSLGRPAFDSWEEIEPFARAHPAIEVASGISMARRDHLILLGADRNHLSARRLLLASGRSFRDSEIEEGAAVCILEAKAGRNLLPGRDPLGGEIQLSGGQTLRVVGVLKERPAAAIRIDELGYEKDHSMAFVAAMFLHFLGVLPSGLQWLNTEENVIVPWRFLGASSPRWLFLRSAPEGLANTVEEIRQDFAVRGIEPLIYSNVVAAAFMAPELEGLLSLSKDIFGFCLLVGVVVVANVSLLSVNERRLEIAIRRCEGATTADVVAQFMLETGFFCSAGAVLGVPLGLTLAWVRSSLEPAALVSWAIPWHHIAVTIASVVLGGMVAGIAPAWRAARLDPVEVLSRA